ncbi:MAG: DNA topoisomerase IV subunit A [Vicinamibacterales bacterium]|nr:DNA topoisomerase IV subunit A [Vicinamibacterales bacterium]MDP7480466.1 DNA topoisomerase IV subunit A [Vicinamibacterales bacterium]HJN45863.1 DNA topoisomerase IV subunit A [Vicinamibacterales bacterium]
MAKRRKRRGVPLFDGLDSGADTVISRPEREPTVELTDAAESRYLNYALSVITSRALPDVRDGLKPVQRRILFTMWEQRITADAKPRKSAKVVGDVMGGYHPHGDTALYDTLVRMAQPFALRYPLIDGHGNFGSLDGDSAAAMRYTECRLAPPSAELLGEINQDTVHFRPNYDGTKVEPVVLPARLPNLLINGATGIAVGMATNIPPHHVGEVCTALLKLLDNPELSSERLCRYIKGPEFPTGGQVLNTPDELKQLYKTGSGSIRLRATWKSGPTTRGSKTIHVTSVPYMVNKAQLVERIAEVILARKLPPLVDVRDESTDEVRIALELKRDADERLVMAYLFRHTPLQTNFAVNLTCLVPTAVPEVGRPERLDLHQLLSYFLGFRLEVVTRRLEHELAALRRRIHILEGFETVFDALDEVLRIVRKSDGKADAAAKIMKRFALDAEQTDAILELKVYRLARLEILVIRQELSDKRKRTRQIGGLLKNEAKRWALVRDEIREINKTYGQAKTDPRRTLIESAEEEVEYRADDFIVAEDNIVLVTADGWVKRQKEVRDVSTTRLREGDTLLTALAGSTRATVVFFSNSGVAYTARIADVPATTGHGEPIQRLFKLKDGERIVAALSLDPRVAPNIAAKRAGATPPVHAVAVSSDGYSLRFSLEPFVEPSTRSGRRFARPTSGARVVGVARTTGAEVIIAATAQARAMLCAASDINFLSGPGKGVILIKLPRGADRVLGFIASTGDRDLLTVETNRGASQTVSTAKYSVTGRGGKGRELLQRGQFIRVIRPAVTVPTLVD